MTVPSFLKNDLVRTWRKRKLPREAIRHIQEELAEGHLFSQLLLKNVDWDNGTATTYFPKRPDPTLLVNFKKGDHPGRVERFFHQDISRRLKTNSNKVLFLEDRESRADDGGRRTTLVTRALCENILYLYCFYSETNKVEWTFNNAASACTLNGALCELPDSVNLEPDGEISAEDLEALSKSVEVVIVSAYDGVCYIMWERA